MFGAGWACEGVFGEDGVGDEWEVGGVYVGVLEGVLGCGEGGGWEGEGGGGGEGEGVGGVESGEVWDGDGGFGRVCEEVWVGLGSDG